jgi:uncharacterized protein with HEPN domain
MNLDRTPAHLMDMLGFVLELQGLIVSLDESSFAKQRVLCLAVEKLFLNLGEAAVRAGPASAEFPEIPWRRIIGLRNILAHGYEQVAHEILYQTILTELPPLAENLRIALKKFESNQGY